MVGRDERVEPRARPDIDDAFTRLESAQRKRIADTGERLDRAVGQRVDDVGFVPESRRIDAADVEVERAMWVDRDLAVLVPYLLAQHVRIDEQIVIHCSVPLSHGHW